MNALVAALILNLCGTGSIKNGKVDLNKCKIRQNDCQVTKSVRNNKTMVVFKCQKIRSQKKQSKK